MSLIIWVIFIILAQIPVLYAYVLLPSYLRVVFPWKMEWIYE